MRKFAEEDDAAALNDIVNIVVQSGVGMNPQSITDAVVAIMDACGDDPKLGREAALLVMRVMQVPQSQTDRIYFDEIGMSAAGTSRLTPGELARRYATYKLRREAPLAGWTRSAEARDSIAGKREKRVLDAAGERLEARVVTAEMGALQDEYERVERRRREISELKDDDEAGYRAAREALYRDNDMWRHKLMRGYRKEMNGLTRKWLEAKSPAEMERLVGEMEGLRERTVEESLRTRGHMSEKEIRSRSAKEAARRRKKSGKSLGLSGGL